MAPFAFAVIAVDGEVMLAESCRQFVVSVADGSEVGAVATGIVDILGRPEHNNRAERRRESKNEGILGYLRLYDRLRAESKPL